MIRGGGVGRQGQIPRHRIHQANTHALCGTGIGIQVSIFRICRACKLN